MSDEVLGRLVRLGQQAFEVRWEAAQVYADARADEHYRLRTEPVTRPGQGSRRRELSAISRVGSLASSRPCPGGHAALPPAACPPLTSQRDNDAARSR